MLRLCSGSGVNESQSRHVGVCEGVDAVGQADRRPPDGGADESVTFARDHDAHHAAPRLIEAGLGDPAQR